MLLKGQCHEMDIFISTLSVHALMVSKIFQKLFATLYKINFLCFFEITYQFLKCLLKLFLVVQFLENIRHDYFDFNHLLNFKLMIIIQYWRIA
jgi:hypothetical protein